MKVAAIYDIHGNLPALDVVLAEIDQARPDLIVAGGDIVSGPMPAEVLERLIARGNQMRFIRGNADREVVAAFDGQPLPANLPEEIREMVTWTAHQLERSHRDFLAGLPEHFSVSIDGVGDVLFCHGSPRSDEEMILVTTPEARLREMVADVRQNVVVCGHTHMQFDRRVDDTRIINAGSVGMPYGEPGAYWLLLGPEVALRRTLYDLEQAAASIRATDYPLAQDFADNNVVNPPSEAEALAVFEQIAAQS